MSIKISSLQKSKAQKNISSLGYLYKDVDFDLKPAYSYNNQLNRKENLKDIQAIFDVEAIKNSIVNCFLTAPGQKILNPTFGIDLRRFLFEPVDDYTSEIIEDDISQRLPLLEPRITVTNVSVIADPDAQEYQIFLQINIPSLDVEGLSIKSKLNTIGYTIL